MNDECQYCLGMDSAIEKVKTEIDEQTYLHNIFKESAINAELKLKDRDQEIERLKDDLYKRTNAELNEQKMRIYQTNLSAELSTKLKEREELIKELRSLGTCDIDCDGLKCSKTCKKKSMIFEKARKIVGGK